MRNPLYLFALTFLTITNNLFSQEELIEIIFSENEIQNSQNKSDKDTNSTLFYAAKRSDKHGRTNVNLEKMKFPPEKGNFQQYVRYTIDTVYCKPNANRLMIIAGFQGDGNYTGMYSRARFNIGNRFQIGGFYATHLRKDASKNPDYNYNIFEAQGTFFFSDKLEKDHHACYIDGIIKEHVTVIETNVLIGGGTGITNSGEAIYDYKSEAQIPIPKSVKMGFTGGVFNWTRPVFRPIKDSTVFIATNNTTSVNKFKEGLYTNVNVTGFSFGLAMSTNVKGKFKFHSYEQEKIYSEDKSKERKQIGMKPLRDKGEVTDKRSVTMDIALELFMATSIKYDKIITLGNSNSSAIYTISDLQEKRFGGRLRMDLRSQIWSLRFEMGIRPGVSKNIYESSATPKFMKGSYILMGVGFGIGAVD